MRVLGIETSCDETGIAIYDEQRGLVAHQLFSQIKVHADYGGVVPELASRDHIRKTLPLIEQALIQAKLKLSDLDAIAYTAGPGLVGSLLVGASIGRSLAYALGIKALAVHHMEGHLLAPLLEVDRPDFPFLALLVSGGHSQLVYVKSFGEYELLGESIDDAAGEAFDKTGKLLGLDYPAGAALSSLAEQGDASAYHFPRPMINKKGFDFSFSGLKTAVATAISQREKAMGALSQSDRANIARGFEDAVVETLVIKSQRALEATGLKTLVVAGGVSANKPLRLAFAELMAQRGGRAYFPRLEFCTDNGAMIAYAGFCRLKRGQCSDLRIQVRPRWPMTQLSTNRYYE